jgi:citrate synthase
LGYRLDLPGAGETGASIVRQFVAFLTGSAEPAIDQTAAELGVRWSKQRDRAERLLNAVLILTIDHELNISSFTARLVASAGSNLYEVVNAAMCAFSGSRHGRASVRTEQFVQALESGQSARAVIQARLSAGEEIPGFGHPLYPGGDPRARLIMQLLWEEFPADFSKIKKKDRGFGARARQIVQRGSGAGSGGQSLGPSSVFRVLFVRLRQDGGLACARR